MSTSSSFEVIIVGGSYSGLSAALSLGRALRQVLVIDSGEPCNQQAPHSHNFITHDGQTPGHIRTAARDQVARYNTVQFYQGLATAGRKTGSGFEIQTQAGSAFTAKKLLFATGLKDIMPAIKEFAACWGISIIHCPYCHGYEVRNERTGIFGNGDAGFHYAQLISHWTKDLVLFTNGAATFTAEQTAKLAEHRIQIIQTKIDRVTHANGHITSVILQDQASIPVEAVYSRPDFRQHSSIPATLGCALTEHGFIQVDALQRTTVPGVYASGDNNSGMRSVAAAVASGSAAGAFINHDLIAEEF